LQQRYCLAFNQQKVLNHDKYTTMPSKRRKNKTPSPSPRKQQELSSDDERAENNSINSNESPAEEQKDEVFVNENDNNSLSSLDSNENKNNGDKSKDPPGSLSSEERREQAAADRLDAGAQRLSQGSNGGRNKSTQVNDHTTHIGGNTDINSNSGRSRDPAGHRASKSSSKSRDGSKKSSRSSATIDKRFLGIESNIAPSEVSKIQVVALNLFFSCI
jgi:hypothetical protein